MAGKPTSAGWRVDHQEVAASEAHLLGSKTGASNELEDRGQSGICMHTHTHMCGCLQRVEAIYNTGQQGDHLIGIRRHAARRPDCLMLKPL